MLTQAGCLARRERLWNALPEHLEWVLIADPRHVHYFCNFWVHPLSFSAGERGLLLLERNGPATLVADNFALRSAAPTTPFVDRQIVETFYDHKHSVINRDHVLFAALKQLSEIVYGRSGTVEAEWLPVGAREVLGLDRERHSIAQEPEEPLRRGMSADLGSVVRHLRRAKHADELEILRLCMRATDAGHARALKVVRPGLTELDVYREIVSAATDAAGRAVLVYGDFRAASAAVPKPGGLPTDHPLEAGEMLILDYSVVIDGYRSDFTNTIAVGGASPPQRELYELVMEALRNGEAALGHGALARDVYRATAAPLNASPHGHTFKNHAGHGLGLAHPEPPIIVPDSDDVLQSGDVVTLEPGLYVEGIGGIRIEHNYLITDDGYECLSQHEIRLE